MGPNIPDLGIFGLEFDNNIVITAPSNLSKNDKNVAKK